MERNDFIDELQVITGVVTNDVNYLAYLLLKDSTEYSKIKDEEPVIELESSYNMDVDSWFSTMEEI